MKRDTVDKWMEQPELIHTFIHAKIEYVKITKEEEKGCERDTVD